MRLASEAAIYIDPLGRNVPGASTILGNLATQPVLRRAVCSYYDQRPDGSRDGGDFSDLQRLTSPKRGSACSFFSVSAGLDQTWLRAVAMERDLFLWTVDSDAVLEKALSVCAKAVITNVPLGLHAKIAQRHQQWHC